MLCQRILADGLDFTSITFPRHCCRTSSARQHLLNRVIAEIDFHPSRNFNLLTMYYIPPIKEWDNNLIYRWEVRRVLKISLCAKSSQATTLNKQLSALNIVVPPKNNTRWDFAEHLSPNFPTITLNLREQLVLMKQMADWSYQSPSGRYMNVITYYFWYETIAYKEYFSCQFATKYTLMWRSYKVVLAKFNQKPSKHLTLEKCIYCTGGPVGVFLR